MIPLFAIHWFSVSACACMTDICANPTEYCAALRKSGDVGADGIRTAALDDICNDYFATDDDD